MYLLLQSGVWDWTGSMEFAGAGFSFMMTYGYVALRCVVTSGIAGLFSIAFF